MTRGVGPVAGAIPSPNIWHHRETYDLLTEAADPQRLVEAAIDRRADPAGRDVVEIGVGTGAGVPWLAARAARVLAIEPHAGLAAIAQRRLSTFRNVRVRQAVAQRLPARSAGADLVLARWAYFFGPGCEPGLAEARRVVRHGGSILVTDVDGQDPGPGYARWFRAGFSHVDVDEVERFWARQGFTREHLDVRWRFRRRSDLEAVLRIEFPPAIAEQAIGEVAGLELRCPTVLRAWSAPMLG